MTVRIPFTLNPLEGQGLASWLDAYAASLDVTPGELADALGLPDHVTDRGPQPVRLADHHLRNICAATALSETAVRAMLAASHPATPQTVGCIARPGLSVIERLRHANAIAPSDRLRHATNLRPQRALPAEADPAIERAGRLPDQLWPAWSIRLVDDDAFEPTTFRSSMLAALLVPHSGLTVREIAALVSEQVQPNTIAFHLRKLLQTTRDGTALKILTELAFAVDSHDLPIDYARRRRLTADSTLIDRNTWASLARKAGARSGGERRIGFARSYLYELLTGCNLHLAPAPYRIASGFERVEYHDFVAGLPRSLVDSLHEHAQGLLDDAGITAEPLQWQPSTEWVSITDWPGAEPDLTDPEPIHEALCGWRARQGQVAAALGISTEHLRYVIRQHPRACPRYPTRRVLAPVASTDEPSAPAGPKTLYLDPIWLRREYVVWRRGLPDIAKELGCKVSALKKFAHEHGIPLRRPSGPEGFAHLDAPGLHPSQVPEPLRSALTGQDPRQRLHRFTVLSKHPSLNQAAQALGAHQSTLSQQLQQLERACGGLLLHRHPHPRPIGPLTLLGEQLCQQAVEHLDLSPST